MTKTTMAIGMLTILTFTLQSVAINAQETKTLPAGTRMYLTLDKQVTSRRGDVDVGEVVPCRVWRDVEQTGIVVIKGGTPAGCRVEKIKRSNMGGVQGKIAVAGMETKAVDGQTIMLQGGYNKEGSGRKAVVWTVGLLLLWPVLFVPGGAAELPPGTVFDVNTVNDLSFTVPSSTTSRPVLNLSALGTGFHAEALLDEFLKQEKPEVLKVRVSKDETLSSELFIDSVNGKTIEPLPLKMGEIKTEDGTAIAIGETKIKPLAKHFQKGINRFDVAYKDGMQRVGTEVILDVQM